MTKRIEVMIDLETMGLGTNAPILSIGAVAFDLFGDGITDCMHTGISLEASMAAGRRPTASTIIWWLQQGEEARRQICQKCEGRAGTIDETLSYFAAWMKSLAGEPHVWGNGANFDISILEQAYLDAGMRAPWGYRHVRCFRTVMAEFGLETDWVKPLVAHDALADAEAQARTLQNCMRRMKCIPKVDPDVDSWGPSA